MHASAPLALEVLELTETYTNDETLQALLRGAPSLTALDVCGNADLSDALVESAATNCLALKSLKMAHCLFSNRALEALCASDMGLVCVYVCRCVCRFVCRCAVVYEYTHTHIHTYIHACIHAYMHAYMYVCVCVGV
jgi:hypothetical protein